MEGICKFKTQSNKLNSINEKYEIPVVICIRTRRREAEIRKTDGMKNDIRGHRWPQERRAGGENGAL